MTDQPPKPVPELSEQEKQLEYARIGGPTHFVNRYNVQIYPEGGGVRITFLEQYSSDLRVGPVYRTAVFMHTGTAAELAKAIIELLIPAADQEAAIGRVAEALSGWKPKT